MLQMVSFLDFRTWGDDGEWNYEFNLMGGENNLEDILLKMHPPFGWPWATKKV